MAPYQSYLSPVLLSATLPTAVDVAQAAQVIANSAPAGTRAAVAITDTDGDPGGDPQRYSASFVAGLVTATERPVEDLLTETRRAVLDGLREAWPEILHDQVAIMPITREMFERAVEHRRRWLVTGGSWDEPVLSPFLQEEKGQLMPDLSAAGGRVYSALAGRASVLPGGGLPRYGDVMAQCDASVGDLVEALAALERAGVVWRGRYRTEVAPVRPLTAGQAGGRTPYGETVTSSTSVTTSTDEVAAKLRLRPGSAVVRTRYTYRHLGVPVREVWSYEPAVLTGGTEVQHPTEGPYAGAGVRLRMAAIGLDIDRTVERVFVDRARSTWSRSELLGVPVGGLLPVVERVNWSGASPVELSLTYCAPDRFVFEATTEQ